MSLERYCAKCGVKLSPSRALSGKDFCINCEPEPTGKDLEKLKKQQEEFIRVLIGTIVGLSIIIVVYLGSKPYFLLGWFIGAFVAGIVAGSPGRGAVAAALMVLVLVFITPSEPEYGRLLIFFWAFVLIIPLMAVGALGGWVGEQISLEKISIMPERIIIIILLLIIIISLEVIWDFLVKPIGDISGIEEYYIDLVPIYGLALLIVLLEGGQEKKSIFPGKEIRPLVYLIVYLLFVYLLLDKFISI